MMSFTLLLACTGPADTSPDGGPDDAPGESGGADSDSGTDSGVDTDGPDPVSPGLAGLDELGIRNVILVHVDTLRSDRLPFYGATRATTPVMSTHDWLVVDGMRTSTSWTIPSSVSVLTAQNVERHGVTHMLPSRTFNAAVTGPTLATWFGSAGYATMAIIGNRALPQVEGAFADFDAAETEYQDLSRIAPQMFTWIDALDPGTPFFVMLQPMDVHAPYSPAEPYFGTFSDPDNLPFELGIAEDEQLAAFEEAYAAATTDEERAALFEGVFALYDEGVLALDTAMGALLDGLHERGLADDTLVVFTSDHGETIGEEDALGSPFFGHGGKVREELVKVPLLFYNPRLVAQEETCLASNVDIGPTLLRAAGVDYSASAGDIDGQPIQAGCRDIVRSSCFFNDVDAQLTAELLVADGTGALRWDCVDGEVLRYDLTTDPLGTTSLAAAPNEEALLAEMLAFQADIASSLGDAASACVVE